MAASVDKEEPTTADQCCVVASCLNSNRVIAYASKLHSWWDSSLKPGIAAGMGIVDAGTVAIRVAIREDSSVQYCKHRTFIEMRSSS